MKINSRTFFGLVVAVVFSASALAIDPYDADSPRFLLSTFRNAVQNRLYIAGSFDGRAYEPVGGSHVYEVTDGTQLRDPSIVRVGGMWYVCHTSGTSLGNAPYFRILASADLQTWVHIKDVSMASVPNTRYTWAPEWFLDEDGRPRVLVSTSYWGTYEHVIHEIHPLDPKNLAGEWSSPQRLFGPAFPEFQPLTDEAGNPVNGQRVGAYDPFLLKIGQIYHLWYFNRSTSSLAHATAPSLLGPFTADATSNLYGTGYWKEGHTMTHLGDSSWRFTYADAITSTLYYIETSDNWTTWTTPTPIQSPEGMVFNHGTVIYNPQAPRFVSEISVGPENNLQLLFPSLKFNAYQIEWSDDLVSWHDDGTPLEGNGEPIQLIRPMATEGNIFYRVRWLPFW